MAKVKWKVMWCDEYMTEEPNTADGKWDWEVDKILVRGGVIENVNVDSIDKLQQKVMNKAKFNSFEGCEWKQNEDGSYKINGESDDVENPWSYMELVFSVA